MNNEAKRKRVNAYFRNVYKKEIFPINRLPIDEIQLLEKRYLETESEFLIELYKGHNSQVLLTSEKLSLIENKIVIPFHEVAAILEFQNGSRTYTAIRSNGKEYRVEFESRLESNRVRNEIHSIIHKLNQNWAGFKYLRESDQNHYEVVFL